MLTADLVNARRRGTELQLVPLKNDARGRALALAGDLIATVESHQGHPLDELLAEVRAIDVGAHDERLKGGLAKLLLDRCVFEAPSAIPSEDLRREVFTRASASRAALAVGEKLDREIVLRESAAQLGISWEALERGLFADLRGAQVLKAFETLTPEALVQSYERGQAQAVLLRAVKVTVTLRAKHVNAVRAFFRRLKFLRLLYVIGKTDEGYQVVLDGPFSLFESVTKYGLQLALVLPALEACGAWKLEADIRWGKEKLPLSFRLAGKTELRSEEPPLPDDVRALQESFVALGTPWRVHTNGAILDLPGVGLTIPDLVFERELPHGKAARVYLEVMGYWSRAAVWQRVELVQAGLAESILFAVSSRLRVSEEALGSDLPSALYVYKGAMSARVIAERLEGLAATASAHGLPAAVKRSRPPARRSPRPRT